MTTRGTASTEEPQVVHPPAVVLDDEQEQEDDEIVAGEIPREVAIRANVVEDLDDDDDDPVLGGMGFWLWPWPSPPLPPARDDDDEDVDEPSRPPLPPRTEEEEEDSSQTQPPRGVAVVVSDASDSESCNDGDDESTCTYPWSRGSVPASIPAHDQGKEPLCYAYACATAIRSAAVSASTEELEPHEDLVRAMAKRFAGGHDKGGKKGAGGRGRGGSSAPPARMVDVLRAFCTPDRGVSCREIDRTDLAMIASLRDGRAVVAEFHLDDEEWAALDLFFERRPTGVLTRGQFQEERPKTPRGGKDWNSRTRRRRKTLSVRVSHAVVVTGYEAASGRRTLPVLTAKNSWGPGFGDMGYFRFEAGALPTGFDSCVEVGPRRKSCSAGDDSCGLLHPVPTPCADRVRFRLLRWLVAENGVARAADGEGIKVGRCGSCFGLYEEKDEAATGETDSKEAAAGPMQASTPAEKKAVARINELLNQKEGVKVDEKGVIQLRDSDHKFRVGVRTRNRKKGDIDNINKKKTAKAKSDEAKKCSRAASETRLSREMKNLAWGLKQ